jgi:AmmeMemoRadiSam system protein B/AmmeMemoRadiSam system protein A
MITAEPVAATSLVERPNLSAEQKQLILQAAGEMISATVTGRSINLPDPTLAGAAETLLSGAFVSLKRAGHLRSCCGGLLDRLSPLVRILHDAAHRTAREDVRFPPVSSTELQHLDIEVWLLFNPEVVTARGEDRVHAVITGGKHGVVVSRGSAHGLLLPGVAADHEWDSRRFLEQVCVKAGLHPSLWKDDDTRLLTFEGEAIHGRIQHSEVARGVPLLGLEELAAYAAFCHRNIVLLLQGATPNYYLPGVPDGTVTGVALLVRRGGETEGLSLHQLSLRPGLALQSTLYALSEVVARKLARERIDLETLQNLDVGVAVFHDAALHGTVADLDLAGLEPPTRAALVMERNRSALVFDPQASATELVETAGRQAAVRRPSGAALYSLETLTREPRLVLTSVPRPVRGPATRPAAVAGKFYPADAGELSSLLDELLAGERQPEPWAAAMVPHAGLPYSGRLAADVLKRIAIPRTVIVLGPKHTPLGVEWAVAPQQTWAMPGFAVESDIILARRLMQAIPGLELDAAAHEQEHAIEVELPFLAWLAPSTRVVGIALGEADWPACRRFAEGLAEVLQPRQDQPLLLISSDMNHFATDAENRRLDALALAALERCNPRDVYETVTTNHISMCGVVPAVIVLETLRLLGSEGRAQRVGYATSADMTGDTSRVVGYAGMLFK